MCWSLSLSLLTITREFVYMCIWFSHLFLCPPKHQPQHNNQNHNLHVFDFSPNSSLVPWATPPPPVITAVPDNHIRPPPNLNPGRVIEWALLDPGRLQTRHKLRPEPRSSRLPSPGFTLQAGWGRLCGTRLDGVGRCRAGWMSDENRWLERVGEWGGSFHCTRDLFIVFTVHCVWTHPSDIS